MLLTLRWDDVQRFDTRWDEVLPPIKEVPQGNVLESLYKMRIRDSEQLKTVLALCDQDIEHKYIPPSDQRLKIMAGKFLEHARNTREKGTPRAVKESREIVTSGNESHPHAVSGIEIAYEKRWKRHFNRQNSQRKRSFRKDVPEAVLEYPNETCADPSRNYWHPPGCQEFKPNQGCSYFSSR